MKLLEVDLSSKETEIRELEDDENYFLGGKGLGFKLLDKYYSSESNPLIFSIGPLSGLKLSGMARSVAVFRSPSTGFIAESSCGGFFASELRKAGYTGLVIKGASDSPVMLEIDNKEVALLPAGHLWGKDTFQTEDEVKKNVGKRSKVVCIGQAGENEVKFACIEHAKGREFGRCGGGALMGSKKLKAIAVRGDGDVESEIARFETFSQLKDQLEDKMVKKLAGLTRTGTPRMLPVVNEAGALPTRYWKDGEFEAVEDIMEDLEKIHHRKRACFGCRIACGKVSKFNDKEVDGPEYETLFSLGSLCGLEDVRAIAEANLLCDRYGMDTISTGNLVAYHLHNNNEWGNVELILDLIRKIAFREGAGSSLADGLQKLDGIHVKGLELPGYDPRALYGTALGYSVCYRGGCHIKHVMHRPNLTGMVDRLKNDGQARLLVELEDFYGFTDSMVICRFVTLPKGALSSEDVVKLYNAVSGSNFDLKQMLERGREVIDLSRKINRSFGLKKEDDRLPDIFHSTPIHKGNSEGEIIEKKDLESMLSEYYRLREW